MQPPDRLIHTYGRRRGRPLRAGRAALVDELLPRLSIAPPRPGVVLDPAALFTPAVAGVWLEIGFGGGEHMAAQAEAHRDIGFIGAEPYLNGLAGLLACIRDRGLQNIRVWPGDVRLLLPAIAASALGRVFILFPDPWPKKRHHKRRLITTAFLDELGRVMAAGAELRLATDEPSYFAWTLEQIAGHWAFEPVGQTADWRIRPADWPATRYEVKAIEAGRKPVYLRYRRRADVTQTG